MKKVILWMAILLVAFVPTYILIFQGIKTAVPEVSLGDEGEIKPAYVEWVTTDAEGNEKSTHPMTWLMRFLFNQKDPNMLATLSDLGELKFEESPNVNYVDVYGSDGKPVTYQLADIAAGNYTPLTEAKQVVVGLVWTVSSRVTIRAFYSFEVPAEVTE